MVVYKFRVTFDDPEDVSRDIEIRPGQTFENFHIAIQDAISFDCVSPASFFTSDDYWRKDRQISFEQLKDSKLLDFIEDPHQKFIYEYEANTKWTFTIELLKIVDGDQKNKYPNCVKTTGVAPLQFKKIDLSEIEAEAKAKAEESGTEIDDSLFYIEADEMAESFAHTGVDEEDSKRLEGEEVFDEEEESEFDEFDESSAIDDDDF
ncbi:MAG: plasmid pRiA4b ORF-3 family protein [Bacteroidota bacterium]|nr:plasmid pRiA4b ORF-3 family protein [Bacteroidota bacterium]